MDEKPHTSNEADQLIQRAGAGDNEAFRLLFTAQRPYLAQLIRLRIDPRLAGRIDASDVIQETQLVAFQRMADYASRKPMPFRIWLRQTALERLINLREKHLGAERRDARRELALPERSSDALARQLIAGGLSPSEHAMRRERADAVRAALSRLPESDREILLMRNVEALSYDEIGSALDIQPATARKRYGRCLIRLQNMLRDSGLRESSQ